MDFVLLVIEQEITLEINSTKVRKRTGNSKIKSFRNSAKVGQSLLNDIKSGPISQYLFLKYNFWFFVYLRENRFYSAQL